MKTSNFISSALLAVSILISNNFAQSIKSDSVNSLGKGKISVQFGIGENLTIGAFNGYALSCKYNLSNRSAMIFGVAGSFRNNTGTDTRDSVVFDYYDNAYSYTIDPEFLFYFNEKSTITLFAGAGPIISFLYGKNKESDAHYTQYQTDNTWEAGGKILLGCEWFFMRRVSIFADYEATFTIGKRKRTGDLYDYYNGTESHFKSDVDLTNFRANTVKFGLSVYF